MGTLLLDYYHSNPSMLTFVYILRQAVHSRSSNGGQGKVSGRCDSLCGLVLVVVVDSNWFIDVSRCDDNCEESVRTSCLARNRWLVAYTLINNPSLIRMRPTPEVAEQMSFVRGLLTSRERPGSDCGLDSCGDDNRLMESSNVAIVHQGGREDEVHGQIRETEV